MCCEIFQIYPHPKEPVEWRSNLVISPFLAHCVALYYDYINTTYLGSQIVLCLAYILE